jgi:hypothetical protein
MPGSVVATSGNSAAGLAASPTVGAEVAAGGNEHHACASETTVSRVMPAQRQIASVRRQFGQRPMVLPFRFESHESISLNAYRRTNSGEIRDTRYPEQTFMHSSSFFIPDGCIRRTAQQSVDRAKTDNNRIRKDGFLNQHSVLARDLEKIFFVSGVKIGFAPDSGALRTGVEHRARSLVPKLELSALRIGRQCKKGGLGEKKNVSIEVFCLYNKPSFCATIFSTLKIAVELANAVSASYAMASNGLCR